MNPTPESTSGNSNGNGNGNSAGGFDLTQFYQVFFEEAGENLASMEQLLLGLDVAAPEDETLHAIFRCAHSIKGGAATFGFEDLAALTHTMETLLDKLRRHEMNPSAAMVDTLLQAGDALQDMLQRRQDGDTTPVDVSGIAAQLGGFVNGESIAPPVAAPASAPVAAAPAPVVPPAPQATGLRDLEILAGPLGHPSVADDLLTLFSEVTGAGDLVRAEALPGQAEGCVRFRLSTQTPDADLLDLCGFHVPREHIRIAPWPADNPGYGLFDETPLVAAAAAVIAAAAAPAATPAATPVPAAITAAKPAGAPAAAAAKPPKRAATGADTTIRVAVDKVDQLINLMGELVITQAMLAQRASGLDNHAHQQLVAGLADLERTTRDLQDSVMSIRMIPMADVFNRFPRMLRDLAQRLEKQVEFHTVGEATELDKSMIEKITDPLTHLVRNSVDHGIEQPAQRLAAGKPAHGTLTLSAQHAGGCILIQVRDDGRGLDRDRILAKARGNGMVLPENITDAEVWQLIFAPGFSTAEIVTEVSGRGVGMDVVKRNILALGGTVDLDSAPGLGTCVSVRLPLTLAILDGMSVSVEEELYVLPLAGVMESFQAPAASIKTLAGGGRVVKVREDYLPIVALDKTFSVQRLNDQPDQLMLVIVESEGRQVALQVDRLVGQQQVVVKNLEANYRRVPNVSGATIMGDGRVALILDIGALVRGARY
jgi:two-component system chemotaxis sensor kinase CheA